MALSCFFSLFKLVLPFPFSAMTNWTGFVTCYFLKCDAKHSFSSSVRGVSFDLLYDQFGAVKRTTPTGIEQNISSQINNEIIRLFMIRTLTTFHKPILHFLWILCKRNSAYAMHSYQFDLGIYVYTLV